MLMRKVVFSTIWILVWGEATLVTIRIWRNKKSKSFYWAGLFLSVGWVGKGRKGDYIAIATQSCAGLWISSHRHCLPLSYGGSCVGPGWSRPEPSDRHCSKRGLKWDPKRRRNDENRTWWRTLKFCLGLVGPRGLTLSSARLDVASAKSDTNRNIFTDIEFVKTCKTLTMKLCFLFESM